MNAGASPARRGSILLLLILTGGLYLYRLGDLPFLGKDEPKNAEALREMMVRGDWVTTTLREEPWFDKPILYYWGSLVFFHWLGPSELAARLIPVLCGWGGVLLTWAYARRRYGEDIAIKAAWILATSLEYFWFSRTAVVDLPLTLCVALSLVAFHRALEEPGSGRVWYPVAFAAMGGATLAKGPVGVILPALVAGSYLLLARRLGELRRIPWLTSLASFLLVAAPWYVMVSLRHGERFWDDFILNRNINRYLTTVHHHPGPIYYYLPVLIIGLFPWGALFPFGVGAAVAGGWRSLFRRGGDRGFLLLWVAMPVLFFSFAGSKLPSYLLPCFPALAILTAEGWTRAFESEARSPRGRRWAAGSLVLIFPILAAAIYGWCRSEAPEQLPAQLPLALLLGLTTLALVGTMAAGAFRRLFPVCAGGTVVCLFALLHFSLGSVREEASLTRIAARGAELARAGERVVAYRSFHNYLFYYTENRVEWVKRRPELDRLLAESGAIFCFLEANGRQELEADPAIRVEILDRQYKLVLARVERRPAPEDGG